MEEKEVLIVGGGIAGHVLAHYVLKKNKTVSLYDVREKNLSSRIAAGLFNPIVLKRLNLAWKAHETMDEASEFYRTLEEKLNGSFFYKKPLLRIFANNEEANNWDVKSDQNNYHRFIDPNPEVNMPDHIKAPFGVGQVKEAGFMEMSSFFNASEKFLEACGVLKNESVDYSSLHINDKGIFYKNSVYKRVVFCEGVGALENPYFNYLPIQPNKGDILTIESIDAEVSEEFIFSKSLFLIPLGDRKLRAGSTYQRKWEKNQPDPEKRKQILERTDQFFKVKKAVVHQDWGLRPTVSDRRPILGKHPEHDRFFILNGLGSRGVLMAPLLSKLLLESIYENSELPKEINISRFDKFFNI